MYFWICVLIIVALIIYCFYNVDDNTAKFGDYYIKALRDKNGNVINKFDDIF